MALRNLASLSTSKFRAFFDSFDSVLCDCDGTVWHVHQPIPGVRETLQKLKQCDKTVRFVSNNSTFGLAGFCKKIVEWNLDVVPQDIVYPTLAIISHLQNIDFDKELFIIGTSYMRGEFRKAGFLVSKPGPGHIEERLEVLEKVIADNENIGGVIFDFDVNLNYIQIMQAFTHLQRPDVLYMTGVTDLLVPMGNNRTIMGPAPYQDAIEKLISRPALQFGKPSLALNNYITENFKIRPPQTLFVGDSLRQDMEFASKCGYQKLLVLSGLTTLEEAQKCSKEQLPDFYIDSLGDLHKLISEKLNV